MANVGNGNLLVQVDDVDVHERGIDLAFRRTYNSMSGHDWPNSDHSMPSNFGNGWTNTFDAHVAYYNGGNTLSVYDIDGTRYDYTASGGGAWFPPPGMQGTSLTLATQSGYNNNCYYQWTKKNGTAYIFYAPDYNRESCAPSGLGPGLNGRVAEIFGRNSNNYVQFDYSWQGGIVDSGHLGSITAAHADGQQLILSFALTNGTSPCDGSAACELHSITRPDNQAITYSYDTAGDLTEVDRPGDNANSTLPETYGYQSGKLWYVTSPRYVLSSWATSGNPVDGSVTYFAYNGNGQLQYSERYGVMNFTPNDGTGTLLQPTMPSGMQTYYQQNFSGYNSSGCTTGGSGSTMVVTGSGSSATTTVTDTEGHSTQYALDGCWRLTQTQDYTGTQWLLRNEGWDNQNDLIAQTDDRGDETDYAYDANGNVTEVAQPNPSSSLVNFRPTKLYSYDTHDNVTAYCDPVETDSIGANWTSSPGTTGDSLCPSQSGAQRFTWAASSANTFGYLTDMYTAAYGSGSSADPGYHTRWTYDSSREGGVDAGLPTTVAGDSFVQQNGTTAAPTQNFLYDVDGNLLCYSKLTDTAGTHWWRLTYDNLNRQTAVADPDDDSLKVSQCSNTAGISGSHIVTTTSYYADGETASTQTPSEYAGGVSTTYAYDADGDQSSKTAHYGNVAGTTTTWYDGEDRVVEVQLPHDATDYFTYNWLTRDVYDISQGQALTVGNVGGIYAHGNLYKTEKWFGSKGWSDIKGYGYDALDRTTASYSVLSWQSGMGVWSSTYDSGPQTYGLLSQKQDPLLETTTYAYDNDDQLTNTTYSGDGGVTPAETATYDADGRLASRNSSSMGTQTQSYDLDGQVAGVTEPSSGGLTSPATFTYSYYPNGLRSALSVNSSALTQNNLLQYDYRNDGTRSNLNFNEGSTSANIAWTLTPAARMTGISDSSGQPARALTYDAYGRITQDHMPAATISGEQYDDEGERTAYTYPLGNTTIGYNVRGELTSQTYSNAPAPCGSPPVGTYANMKQQGGYGPMVPEYYDCSQMKWAGGGSLFDFNTGANLGPTNTGNDSVAITYDKANRQTSSTDDWQYTTNSGDGQQTWTGSGTVTRTYDAENHLLSEDTSGQWNMYDMPLADCIESNQRNLSPLPQYETASGSYAWGPNGHPDIIDGSTYHWDGDSPIFVTSSAGALERVDIEGLAIFSSGSVQFLDRDQTGSVVASHANGSAGTWNPATPYHEPCGAEDLSDQPGPDGIDDGTNILQGVRNYDPSLQQWSTPDAYQGEVSDPMSQQPYMWNRNNPFKYQDPSGYDPFDELTEEDAAARIGVPGNGAYGAIESAAMERAGTGGSVTGDGLGALDSKMSWNEASDMLRAAASGKGNFSIGSATQQDADALGEAWVGKGATWSRTGKALIGKNGRIYRPGTFKPKLGKRQANLEQVDSSGRVISNAHVDIKSCNASGTSC